MNKFIVFDLDGTLMDTIGGITLAINNTLENFKYKYRYTEKNIRGMIGKGAKSLFLAATKRRRIIDEEFDYYNLEYIKTQTVAKVYDGVFETLELLRKKGYKLIIFSNKPDGALRYLVEDKLSKVNWLFVRGNSEDFPPKPDPTGLFDLMKKCGLKSTDIGYYVGDSVYDVETAKNANLKSVLCLYGYGDYEKLKNINCDIKINSFKELGEKL